jgi:hypothetical protein
MAVENFWRNLKHETLHHLLHPRLDQLIFLIATDVLPHFVSKMQIFEPDFRRGRAPELTPFQVAFKRNWKKLAARELGTRTYNTNVQCWTCTCGQQKYNPYINCKHLVQAVQPPLPRFFAEVVRRRVIPFYHHPLLKLKDGSPVPALEFTRSISNGDLMHNTPFTTATTAAPPSGAKRKRAVAWQPSSDDGTDEDTVSQLLGAAPSRSASPSARSSSPVVADEYDEVSFLTVNMCSKPENAAGHGPNHRMDQKAHHRIASRC